MNKALTVLRAYLTGIPYPKGGKEILKDMEKCGISFSIETRTIEEWFI